MVRKFLFREKNVGTEMWNVRNAIVELYFGHNENPFVSKGGNYSVSDFEMMTDFLRIKNII